MRKKKVLDYSEEERKNIKEGKSFGLWWRRKGKNIGLLWGRKEKKY